MTSFPITTFRYDNHQKEFTKKTVERRLGIHEILIRITHSGICYTDVHAKEKGCGLGHEGVGIVEKVGLGVAAMKEGDRVGWGWLRASCGQCPSCLGGYRQYCASASGFAFCDLDQGAFADYHIVNAEFAYHIPLSIDSADAGVFMCAGASTYEALEAAGTRSSDRVGVVGIGGLGHMAILFAKAKGCSVTAISGSGQTSKAHDAFELGADEVRMAKEPMKAMHRLQEGVKSDTDSYGVTTPINVLLICSNEVPALETLLPLLDRRATIVLMSIQSQPLYIPYMPFILPGHKLISSTEASKRNHVDMLNFAAANRIKPWIETFPMTEEGVHRAFTKLEAGSMRYRGVLERKV